jgi:hypothetical protein
MALFCLAAVKCHVMSRLMLVTEFMFALFDLNDENYAKDFDCFYQ